MPQRKPEVTRRTAAGISYELTRKKVKRLNLHIRRDGTVAVSIPWSYAVGFADAFVTEQAQWIREAVSRQLRRNARNDQPLPSQAEALACFTAMSDKVYPAFAGGAGRAETHHQGAGHDQQVGRVLHETAADHLCIAALQYAARRTDLCGGARILPLPAAQPQPGLLGRGGKAAAGLERTAGFIEINLVIKINRRGSTLGK